MMSIVSRTAAKPPKNRSEVEYDRKKVDTLLLTRAPATTNNVLISLGIFQMNASITV